MKIAIVGCGNILLGDEGVGPYILGELRRRKSMPKSVELIELGVRGIELVDLIGRFDKIFIVDAVKTGGRAGAVHVFTCNGLGFLRSSSILTLHDLGLATVLKLCETLYGDISSKVKIFGVEVAVVERVKTGISPSVKRGASKVVRLLEEEVSSILK